MELLQKLAILADAAKYDASCASGGAGRRDSLRSGGLGNSTGMGICHADTPDGRCVSLLKILLTNFCLYDCAYCINRAGSNVRRARFRVDEVVTITLDFYRRNCIEGLFLSSGIIRSSDYTMEQMVEVARRLREEHRFAGYIHLKTIPEASPELIERAGRYADRLSINVELPTEAGLRKFAPEKRADGIRAAMGQVHTHIARNRGERRDQARQPLARAKPPRFAPGGQSTQMIVGADGADDATILRTSHRLYDDFRMRRVYYSAFSPIPDASAQLPPRPPPLHREHRLYQANWLLHFYGFGMDKIADTTDSSGLLALDIDPKRAWALQHPEQFPVDLNHAPKERLLRVPGLGVRNMQAILRSRRHARLRLADVARLSAPLARMLPFINTLDHHPRRKLDDPTRLRAELAMAAQTDERT